MPMLNAVVAITIRNFDPCFVNTANKAYFFATVEALVYIVSKRNCRKLGYPAGSVLTSPRCHSSLTYKLEQSRYLPQSTTVFG